MNFTPVHFTFVREDKKHCFRTCCEEIGYIVLFLGFHALQAFSTTFLNSVFVCRHTFDQACVCHSHNHVFVCDQIFIFDIIKAALNLRTTRICVTFFNIFKFSYDDFVDFTNVSQNEFQPIDLFHQLS
ncbi:hypothetical protein D3C72_1888620 [compost metagenome]